MLEYDGGSHAACGGSTIRPNIEDKIVSGSEFDIYRYGSHNVLKLARRPWLMNLAFGDFHRKAEHDLTFLDRYFGDYLPATRIIFVEGRWGIQQRNVDGIRFSADPKMTPQASALISRALSVYRQTGRIPDLLNPGNLFVENGTGRLYLIDTSVLGCRRYWPAGYWVSGILARILYDTLRRRLHAGKPIYD